MSDTNDLNINLPEKGKTISNIVPEPELPIKESSRVVDIDVNAKVDQEKTIVDFKSESVLDDFIKQPTEQSNFTKETLNMDTPQPNATSEPKTVGEIRQGLINEEKDMANSMTEEDFRDTADMIVDLVNLVMVFILRLFAKDNTDAPYEPPIAKLNALKKGLTKVLIRYNKSFPLGTLFLLAVLAAYATPAKKAWEHKKEVDKYDRERKRQQALRDQQKTSATVVKPISETKTPVKNNSDEIITPEYLDGNTLPLKPKRKRGQFSK